MCNPTKMADDKLCLPIDATGKPDFAYMQAYISAIKKLVIADVAKWKERELAAMREAVADKT